MNIPIVQILIALILKIFNESNNNFINMNNIIIIMYINNLNKKYYILNIILLLKVYLKCIQNKIK